MILVGDDWSEGHHDVCVMDANGAGLASRRLAEGVEGLGGFHELVAGRVDDPSEVVVGIETDRGLWVQALVASGYQVFVVNPKSMSRYRDRYRPGHGKSDTADAMILADVMRTDRHHHRRIAGDSFAVSGINMVARAHQTLVWERTRHSLRLRSCLREYYPAAIDTFADLADRDTLAILAKAPSPDRGARLSMSQIRSALKRGGRQRYLDARAAEIKAGLGTKRHLAAPAPLTDAMAAVTTSTVAILETLNEQIAMLETKLASHFEEHPDAHIYLSLPGVGNVIGARMLGEFGDDPKRFANAKSRRNYAATSPITTASGKRRTVGSRYIKNRRLSDATIRWAFCSISADPDCRAFYDNYRNTKHDNHNMALRALANQLVGILHGCLRHRQTYDPAIAWKHHRQQEHQKAA